MRRFSQLNNDANQGISTLEGQAVAERQNLQTEWEFTPTGYPHDASIHQLFEAQALRTPDAIAVQFDRQSLTYAELNGQANQLASLLRKRGVQREVLVGLCLDRSLEMVVALLGTLKAGGAYVPLDPAYPKDRIKYVLEDARVKVLLTQQSLLDSLPRISAETICLDSDRRTIAKEKSENLSSEAGPQNLAYVIYTSGSTGKPKGVQVEHRSVVNFLCSMRREPGLDPRDVLLAVTTLSFDIAGLEIYLPLLTGSRLVITSRAATYDARQLMELLEKSHVTVMQATPATWRLLIEGGWRGDRALKVLVGGEAVSPELARSLAFSCGSVWNMYGPTETTIWSSLYRVNGQDERIVPIGRPIANTTFYILDGSRKPVRAGAEGELYIGGEGLARGYLERRELTAEKFLADPFSSRAGARMYRTGDLVRCRADGNVEFLGRLDHQVKIRGFRVELGEIEAVLEQHTSVRRAVVVADENTVGEKRLVAYLVPDPDAVLTARELRSHVQKQLPDYMTPAAFVQLATLPLTPNGKVNRSALPAPRPGDFEADQNYVAPRDAVERKLARLWEEVLGIHPIGVRTSFFDLGGRSLLAARLFTKISRAFGKDLPLATLFHSPTIEQLAQAVRPKSASGSYTTLVAIQPNGSKLPFFCVHGGAGSALFLHRLAREMDPDQPFYGIEPEGLNGKRFQRTTVEQMAAHYLSEIRKVQTRGPYHIGGYCFGGLAAFEMARQLQQQGEHADVVAMFSASLRFNRVTEKRMSTVILAPKSKSTLARLRRLIRSPRQAIGWRMASLMWTVRSQIQMQIVRLFLNLGLRIPNTLRTLYVMTMLGRAEQNYAPGRYEGTLTLFRGRGLYENDPNMGWDGLAESFENYEIGDGGLRSRRDIMNEPLVGLLAKQLSACLERVRDSHALSFAETTLDRSLASSNHVLPDANVVETAD
jgi:amino acid adenylation domain-containing protein